MKVKFKSLIKKVGVTALSMGLLLGTVNIPTNATTEGYVPVVEPNTDGKVAPTLIPKGANMDELVEVIIQFKGNPVLKEFVDSGKKLRKKEQRAHAEKLKGPKKAVTQQIVKNNGKVISSFEKVYNGLYVQVKRSDLNKLAQNTSVKGIYAVSPVELHNDAGVPFIGAPDVWEKVVDGVNVTGEGITVAVIDTGIDYTHASFGGEGTVEAYTSNDPNVVEEGSFPTAKVIGGYDFVGTDYSAGSSDPELRIPKPDADPLDEQSHGTHVAATVAGLEVEGKVGKGVAPGALLYAYKVFGKSGSTAVTTQALEMAVDPNGDGDVSDHVDVVNMSLGSPYGHPNDSSAVATDLAVEAGIIVVASAGNSGDIPYITGSPAVAEKAISVAASVDDGVVVGGIQVNSPSSIAGTFEAVEGAITKPLSESGNITEDVIYLGRSCNGDTLLGDPTGKIALIDRGSCAFTDKLTNALNAGAIAAIVANNVAGAPITMGGSDVNLPGVMVSLSTGDTIKSGLAEGAVNVTLSDDIKIGKPELADTIAGFSSKGPGRPLSGFKPEISAPGFNIDSAAFGTGDQSRSMSGTSMAAPHIAGVVALLKQLNPDWSPEEIKSLIMNTSIPMRDLSGEVYPLSRQGAGRVQANVAANTSTVVSPSALALGYVPVSEEVLVSEEVEVMVTNKGTADKAFSVSWENRHGDTTGPVSVSFSADSVLVNAGESKDFRTYFAFNSAELSNKSGFHEFDGYVVLTELNGSGEVLRVPYQAVVEKVSKLELEADDDKVKIKNHGATTSVTDLFAFGELDPAEVGIDDYFDIRAVGARASGGVVEFGIATEGPWSTPNLVEFDVYIDSNMDGVADYILFNYDLYALYGYAPSGDQVSVLYNLSTRKLSPLYYVNVGGSWNDSVIGLPVPASYIGGSGEFQYQVVSFGSGVDFNDGGWITFNSEEPSITFESNRVNVEPGAILDVPVSFNGNSTEVLILNNSDPTKSEYDVINFN